MGGGAGNGQDNLERERERRRSGRGRGEGCTSGGEEGDSDEWGRFQRSREYVAVAPRWGKIDRLPTPWRGSGGSGVAREEARTCAKDTLNR